jgi:hypothetical protein
VTTVDIENKRAELMARYEQLDSISQHMLQLASIIYYGVGRSDFVVMLRKAGVRNAIGKVLAYPEFKQYLETLAKQELMLDEQGKPMRCAPLIVEILTRKALASGNFDVYVEAQGGYRYKSEEYRYRTLPKNALIHDMRIAIYRGDNNAMNVLSDHYDKILENNRGDPGFYFADVFFDTLSNPFDAQVIEQLVDNMRIFALERFSHKALITLEPVSDALPLIFKEGQKKKKANIELGFHVIKHLLLQGKFDAASKQLKRVDIGDARDIFTMVQAQISFLQEDVQAAITHFEESLTLMKKRLRKRKYFYTGDEGILFILALLAEGSSQRLQEGLTYIAAVTAKNNSLHRAYMLLKPLLEYQNGDLRAKERLKEDLKDAQGSVKIDNFWIDFVIGLCSHWVNVRLSNSFRGKLEQYIERATANGYSWLEKQLCDLLNRFGKKKPLTERVHAHHKKLGGIVFADVVKPVEAWSLALQALENFDVKTEIKNANPPPKC